VFNISSFISLGKLGLHFSLIPSETRTALFHSIYRTRESDIPQQCSNILYGLATMQASWNDFDEKATEGIRERIKSTGKNFNEQVRSSLIIEPGAMLSS
jgi:hypothetical protein